jgi:hypothetical protein
LKKEAITTNAIFVALGYNGRYKQISVDIPLDRRQAHSRSALPLFDNKADTFRKPYEERIKRLERLRSEVETCNEHIRLIMSQDYSTATLQNRLKALTQISQLLNRYMDQTTGRGLLRFVQDCGC